jgi:amino acid transporter
LPAVRLRLKRLVLGAPRDLRDPRTFHAISLVALLAWVGLGADGLSSSSYGPDEAFRALGQHHYLAIALALATTITVLVISVAYSHIIQHFPYGGGGYVVASRLLGPSFGVVSGSALLVDYVLTISVSIACGADQIFSVLPHEWAAGKLLIEALVIGILVVMNLRGVKESVTILAPIFALFVVAHVVLIAGGIGLHAGQVPAVARDLHREFRGGLATLGLAGMFGVFLKAYSMGAGTYTGIEAVSNGLQIMREPRVRTARITMTYMSLSLALTAGGILICYLLFHVQPVRGQTLNAVLLDRFSGGWRPFGLPLGHAFVVLTLASEAALLFVAAQAGFIDGPRVMGNMAGDSWLPHRFAQLSSQLTMQNGVVLMGGAAIAVLYYTHGNVTALVVMYSINVFLTFSLSQLGMLRFWWRRRGGEPAERRGRRRGFAIHGVALLLCASILAGTIVEKGAEGGWVTLLVTALLVALCFQVRRHYDEAGRSLRRLDDIMADLPLTEHAEPPALDRSKSLAVALVGAFGGLGMHVLLDSQRLFPSHFRQILFVSVGVVEAGNMKGVEEVDRMAAETEAALQRYVGMARGLGLAAEHRMALGTEAAPELEELCVRIAREYPRAIFFASRLVFQEERWYQRFLHNETAHEIQRRLQFRGLNAVILPVRVFGSGSR